MCVLRERKDRRRVVRAISVGVVAPRRHEDLLLLLIFLFLPTFLLLLLLRLLLLLLLLLLLSLFSLVRRDADGVGQ